MLWLPTDSVELVQLAWPVDVRAAAAQSVVCPSENVTVPDGRAASGASATAGATSAPKVTPCPSAAGFADEETVAVVGALATGCGTLPWEFAKARWSSEA